jgi:ATP-dependent Clp protease ATP-binding subunit ClpX (EC 3.4.21.92)
MTQKPVPHPAEHGQPQLEFEPEAIHAIAQEAHRRKTGARALRGIVEELMLDLMYDLPSQTTVKEFTITQAMVEQHTGGKVLPLPGNEQQKTA